MLRQLRKLVPRYSLRTLVVFLLLVTSGVGLGYSCRLWVRCLTIRTEPGLWHDAGMSRDGAHIVTFGDAGKVCIWSAETGERLHVLSGHKGYVHRAGFSRDDSMLVTLGQDGKAMVWDVATGRRVQTFDVGSAVELADFSADGRSVLTKGPSGQRPRSMVRPPRQFVLWSVETGKAIVSFPGRVHCYLPAEGNHVVCTDYAGKSLHDAATGERLGVVREYEFDDRVELRDPTTKELIRSVRPGELCQRYVADRFDRTKAFGGEEAEERAGARLPEWVSWRAWGVRQDGLVVLAGAPGGINVMRYSPPAGFRGLVRKAEFWLTAAFATIFVSSVLRDRRALAPSE